MKVFRFAWNAIGVLMVLECIYHGFEYWAVAFSSSPLPEVSSPFFWGCAFFTAAIYTVERMFPDFKEKFSHR